MEIGSCKTPSFMGDSCSLAWSNDGRTVATTTSSGIRLYDAVSPSSEPIASLSVDGVPDHVNWTADDRLVFTVTQVSANGTRIDMMDIDGTNERTIVDTRAEGFGFQYWSLDLSPDGRTLVWLDGVNGTDPNAQMLVKLMMMDVDDARPRMVRDVGHCYCVGLSPAVTWSPDGGRLALVLVGGGSQERRERAIRRSGTRPGSQWRPRCRRLRRPQRQIPRARNRSSDVATAAAVM